jgi:2-keto-3-deoxy-L-rhamnonate aldolase RhmA
MLKENRLRVKLAQGQQVYGLFCSIPSPIVVEMIGCAGYDFVIIDTEHVLVNPETIENMIRAADAAGLTPFVRVSEPSSAKEMLRALDAGAQGVVIPCVESKEQAEFAVRACRYHPLGARSLNGGRAGAFGKHSLAAYIGRANAEIMVIPMLESRLGIQRADDILSAPGIDMVLEGAADLSQSLGVPWQLRAEPVREALLHAHAAAKRNGVPYCAIPRAAEDVKEWHDRGVRAFVLGDERGISFRALRGQLQAYLDIES